MSGPDGNGSRGGFDPEATQTPPDPSTSEDPRLLAAVQEYLAALEAGRRPSRQEVLSRYPDIARELSDCLDGLAFVHSAAAQMQKTASTTAAVDHGPGLELAMARPLGDFQLVREIGRGGMGVVYEAVQLSLGRRVAVKVLPFTAALDTRQLQRFKNEAQAAAQLHHTNIVPVYAVGCERSVHYYAMQLIEGQSLAQVIRELREAAGLPAAGHAQSKGRERGGGIETTILMPCESTGYGTSQSEHAGHGLLRPQSAEGCSVARSCPTQNLSLLRSSRRKAFYQTVARLGLQAAEALDYAHQQGVVHRDIKPENLLLDIKGNLWVTDFGLAQFYAESGLTQTGDLLGTLRYMSPEQASGRTVVLDQRTDVYSLGLTLYELLTLERAIPGQTREQLLYQIGYHEPRSPRSIDKALPPELETILAKATAKDPVDRYPTARALAEDLRRFLQDEPILARPPSLWDRSVKWARRHKSVAVSALVMLVLASVGLFTSTLLIAREQAKTKAAYERERDKATEANQQRARAEKSFKQAREVVDFFSRIAAVEMTKPEFSDVRKEMLEAALAYYQSFLEDRRDDPSIAVELDVARSGVAAILTELSALDMLFGVQFRFRLLSDVSVQKELQLSSDQIERIRQCSATSPLRGPGGPHELRQLSRAQMREMLTEMANAGETQINSILTPSQAQRLWQISRQVRGPSAFNDPDVLQALQLTREQRSAIRTVEAKLRDARFRRGPRFDGPGAIERHQKDFISSQREAVSSILAKLTASQVEIWMALTGEPFSGSVSLFGHPFGPPGRPPEFH